MTSGNSLLTKTEMRFNGKFAGTLIGLIIGSVLAILATAAFEWAGTSCLFSNGRGGCFDGWQRWNLRWLAIGLMSIPIAAIHTAQFGWLIGWWLDRQQQPSRTTYDIFCHLRPILLVIIPIIAVALTVAIKPYIVLRDMPQSWWVHLVVVTSLGGLLGVILMDKLLSLPHIHKLHSILTKVFLVMGTWYLIAAIATRVWIFYAPAAFAATTIAFLILALIATPFKYILRPKAKI